MTKLLGEMAAARLEWTSRQITSWYPRQDLLTQLRTSLTTQADWVGNEAFGSQFRDDVGTCGIRDPLAWANRRLELRDGGWAVTGIRYRGRDITRPFIDVVATTAPPTLEGLALIAQTIVPAYAPFEPLCLRVQVPDAADLLAQTRSDHRFGVGCAVDMHVIAGTLTNSKMQALPRSYRNVGLNPAGPGVLAERVSGIYHQLAQQNPETTWWATPENAESLGACAEECLLFEVTVSDAPAGVVAAARHDAHGMRGFSVDELCLDQTTEATVWPTRRCDTSSSGCPTQPVMCCGEPSTPPMPPHCATRSLWDDARSPPMYGAHPSTCQACQACQACHQLFPPRTDQLEGTAPRRKADCRIGSAQELSNLGHSAAW